MANLLDIRRRIRSVKSTQQITKAMKMVAAARLRRSQERIVATRPYAAELRKVIAGLAGRGKRRHPLLEEREAQRTLLVVVTGDKGLCGSFNATVLRQSQAVLPTMPNPELLLLGKKGNDFFKRRPFTIKAAHTSLFSNVRYEDADAIAKAIIADYVGGGYDAVYLVYNAFKSIISQELTYERLLPIPQPAVPTDTGGVDYLYEPSAEEILAELLVGSSRVDLQACKLEYSIVSPK